MPLIGKMIGTLQDSDLEKSNEVPRVTNNDSMNDEHFTLLIFIRDSLLQSELINIPEDFLGIASGGDHLLKEKLRLDTLLKRVDFVCDKIKEASFESKKLNSIHEKLNGLKTKLADTCQVINSDITLNEPYLSYLFEDVASNCKMTQLYLESTPLPKHWPAEVHSSDDKCPGVGSNERLVQIRMAETFQIYNLDMQARSIMPLMTQQVT